MAMSGTRKTILIITGILGAFLLLVVLAGAVLWITLRRGEPSIRDNSVLALRVSGPLPDYSPDDPLKRYFGGPDQSLTGLVMQFKKAMVDKRIKAILLDVNMSGVGWGKAEEIRDAIADLRSSGKPVYTRDQIQQLYSAHRQGAYAGRESEWNRIEADIFAAQREGRVQGVYLTK